MGGFPCGYGGWNPVSADPWWQLCWCDATKTCHEPGGHLCTFAEGQCSAFSHKVDIGNVCGCNTVPWASYQIRKIACCACAGNAGNVFPRHRLQRKPLVSDPGMHHGTCVTHVPWCMSGSLTRGGGENVPGIPGACATRNFTYLVRGPWVTPDLTSSFLERTPSQSTSYERPVRKASAWTLNIAVF